MSEEQDKGKPAVTVDFIGELHELWPGDSLTIGREGDLVIDDNPFLHRRFLTIDELGGVWRLSNVGQQLTATVADEGSMLQAWLAPGAQLPLVFAHTVVWFTAGSTTYEFDIHLAGNAFEPVAQVEPEEGDATVGRVQLTPDQKLLVVVLCEQVLRRGNRGQGGIPPSADAAARLGWTITKFNRKLDNVCDKLTKAGVRGLHGGGTGLASSRRARLVEYAMTARLVRPEDLELLPPK